MVPIEEGVGNIEIDMVWTFLLQIMEGWCTEVGGDLKGWPNLKMRSKEVMQ